MIMKNNILWSQSDMKFEKNSPHFAQITEKISKKLPDSGRGVLIQLLCTTPDGPVLPGLKAAVPGSSTRLG